MKCKIITRRAVSNGYFTLGDILTKETEDWIAANDVEIISIKTRFHSDVGSATILYRPIPVSTTNSPIGSHHWFHTLLAPVLHIGEFLETHDNPDADILKPWGKTIADNCKELRDGFNMIGK